MNGDDQYSLRKYFCKENIVMKMRLYDENVSHIVYSLSKVLILANRF